MFNRESLAVDSLGRKTEVTVQKSTEYSGSQWDTTQQIFWRKVKVLFYGEGGSMKKSNFSHVTL